MFFIKINKIKYVCLEIWYLTIKNKNNEYICSNNTNAYRHHKLLDVIPMKPDFTYLVLSNKC